MKNIQGEWMTSATSGERKQIWTDEEGRFHREDGPAVLYENGDKSWYRHGELHREDGPAVEDTNGLRIWSRNGKLHREDGPAVISGEGDPPTYWINGEKVEPSSTFEELVEEPFTP